MSLINTTLSTAVANVYVSTGDSTVVSAFFCNTDVAARTFNLYAVPAAGTAGTGNQILKDVSVNAGDTYIMNNERITLANGETLQANASTNSVLVVTVSYTDV